MLHLFAALGGYLAGSLPTGVVVGRYVGQDPRGGGSHNIGASNVTRTLGPRWGFVTLLADMAKGAGPAWIAWHHGGLGAGLLAGGAAVVGHCYPVWLRFAGGKGVATALGTMLVFAPFIALTSALAWLSLVALTRIPAIGSLVAAALFVVLAQVDDQPVEVRAYTVGLLLLLLLRHRSNLGVLRARYAKRR